MIGLAIVLFLIVCFASKTDIVKAYEESEKKIHLERIQTPEHEAAVETLKEQWLTDFNKLFNESQWNTSK